MKKLICNHNFTQKILITILILLLFNFVAPTCSKAVTAGEIGGMILNPILDFTCTVLDALVGGLQKFLVNGKMNENEFGDGGMVNWFLTKPEIVMENKDGRFDESQYNAQDAGKEQIKEDELDDTYYIPTLQYSPQKIFSGLVPALDINFINPKDWEDEEMNSHSSAAQLHNIIAQWYVALRNFSLVGLMIVLLYVGIRILLSSTASDKSKYKQMLIDWVVAVCLLFFLHYIMTFTVTIVTEISNAVNGNLAQNGNNIAIQITNDSGVATDENGKPIQFNTDLMGQIRFKTQYADAGNKILFNMFYLAMVIYTVMFTVTYLKRVLMMAFLTLIAPVVALTYPIDKIGDGKAQAFNMWLKEYIFNALIQPFHLIIYTVFVSSAITLAATNPFYAIIALAFITPAEKILRKFFGFEKSSTAGALNSFAGTLGGAAAFKAISGIVGKGAKGGGGSKGGDKVRTKENKPMKDPNAPDGVDGFDSVALGARNSEESGGSPPPSGGQNGQNPARDLPEMGYGSDGGTSYQSESDDAGITSSGSSSYGTVGYDFGNTGSSSEVGSSGTGRGTPPTSQNNEPEPVRDLASRLVGGFSGAGTAIKNRAATTLGNKAWRRSTAKNMAKGAIGGLGRAAIRTAGAAAMGAVGVAAGIAGDDIGDVFKLGAAGASLGATVVGNKGINAFKSAGQKISGSSAVGGFMEGFTGKSAEERALASQKIEKVADSEFMGGVQDSYRPGGKQLAGKDLTAATERAAEYYNNGITDMSSIKAALKIEDKIMKDFDNNEALQNNTQEEKRKMAQEQASVAVKMADRIDEKKLIDTDYQEKLAGSLAKSIKSSSNNAFSDSEAKANAWKMVERIKQIKKVD